MSSKTISSMVQFNSDTFLFVFSADGLSVGESWAWKLFMTTVLDWSVILNLIVFAL